MAVTYGHVATETKTHFLLALMKLFGIVMRLIPAEKAAMFTAFPFREFHNPVMSTRTFKRRFVVEWLQLGALVETTP